MAETGEKQERFNLKTIDEILPFLPMDPENWDFEHKIALGKLFERAGCKIGVYSIDDLNKNKEVPPFQCFAKDVGDCYFYNGKLPYPCFIFGYIVYKKQLTKGILSKTKDDGILGKLGPEVKPND